MEWARLPFAMEHPKVAHCSNIGSQRGNMTIDIREQNYCHH